MYSVSALFAQSIGVYVSVGLLKNISTKYEVYNLVSFSTPF